MLPVSGTAPVLLAALLLAGSPALPPGSVSGTADPGSPRLESGAGLVAQELHPEGFPYRITIAPTVGLQGFTQLGKVDGLLAAVGGGAAGSGTRAIVADVRAQPGAEAGLSAEWRISGPLVLRGAGGWQSTAMELAARSTREDGSDPLYFEFEEVGRVEVVTAGLSLLWRFAPGAPVVRPYLGGGIGISYWNLSEMEGDPRLGDLLGEEVGIDPVSAVLPAAELLAGVDLPLGGRTRIRLELADHVSRNPLDDRDFHLGSNFEGVGMAEDWVHTLSGGMGLRFRLF